MKRPTSENIFELTNQPSEFCDILDPILNPMIEIKIVLDNLYELEMNNDNIQDFDLSLVTEKNFDLSVFSIKSKEMKEWFIGWLRLFKENVKKEQNIFLKNELECDIVFYQSIIDNFEHTSDFFIQHLTTEFESYNNNVKELKEAIKNYLAPEEEKNIIYSSSFSVECYDCIESIVKINTMIEMLREKASITRQCGNKDLKIRSKIQMYRANDSVFKNYLSEYSVYEQDDFKRKSYLDYKFSINRDYIC